MNQSQVPYQFLGEVCEANMSHIPNPSGLPCDLIGVFSCYSTLRLNWASPFLDQTQVRETLAAEGFESQLFHFFGPVSESKNSRLSRAFVYLAGVLILRFVKDQQTVDGLHPELVSSLPDSILRTLLESINSSVEKPSQFAIQTIVFSLVETKTLPMLDFGPLTDSILSRHPSLAPAVMSFALAHVHNVVEAGISERKIVVKTSTSLARVIAHFVHEWLFRPAKNQALTSIIDENALKILAVLPDHKTEDFVRALFVHFLESRIMCKKRPLGHITDAQHAKVLHLVVHVGLQLW